MNNKINEALKQFNREDLIDDGYERDLDTSIAVPLTLKQMIKYNQLQSNWNSLREWLNELIIPTKTEYGDTTFYDMIKINVILDKMNELERGNNNGE